MVDFVARGFKHEIVVLLHTLVPGQFDLLVLAADNLLFRPGPAIALLGDVLKLVVHDFLARFNAAHQPRKGISGPGGGTCLF